MNPVRQPNILIVDDQPENLQLLATMLTADGYLVRSAKAGNLAVNAALIAPPDLVLLDIKMPEINGYEVCARFKSHPALKEIPIIYISALGELKDKLAAFQSGGVDYINKPFQATEVLARVQTHLQLRRQKVALEEYISRLEKLEHLRDNLTHMIVHDMRTPLMTIDGYLSMLETYESSTITDSAKGFIRESRQAAKRLKRMINETLWVSKLESGVFTLNRSPCNLAELAARVIADFSISIPSWTIPFSPASEECWVEIDSDLIRRVLENLIGNAMKFSEDGGPIKVTLKATGDLAKMEVIDEGPGVAPENQDRIFEKYSQLDQPGLNRGIGLGLTYCKLAVQAHGGEIGVDSRLGHGSTFWFTLKLAPAKISDCEPIAAS